MIRTNARQQGGAVVLTIPADILKLKGIKAGDPLGIDVTPDGFNVRKTRILETSHADPGPVICEPLGIRFPTLYRGVISTSLEDLRQRGLEDDPEATPGEWVIYSLEHAAVIGTAAWAPVNHIVAGDRDESIVIRHHANMESASGYLDAVLDSTEDDASGFARSLFKTEDGIFTFVSVPTKRSWPGPLVVHIAHVPTTDWREEDTWAHAIDSDGKVVVLPELMVPSGS